jgi:hypothetical protein
MYDPTIDSYTDDQPVPRQWVRDAMALALIAGVLLAVLMFCSGCQSITVTAREGASVTIRDSNSKPINAGSDWQAGDAALSTAAALTGGSAGAAIAGAPGALAGAGIGYILNDALQPNADGATCPLPTGNVEIK